MMNGWLYSKNDYNSIMARVRSIPKLWVPDEAVKYKAVQSGIDDVFYSDMLSKFKKTYYYENESLNHKFWNYLFIAWNASKPVIKEPRRTPENSTPAIAKQAINNLLGILKNE